MEGLYKLGVMPPDDRDFERIIMELHFRAGSTEAESWLKYEQHDGKINRFQEAHIAMTVA